MISVVSASQTRMYGRCRPARVGRGEGKGASIALLSGRWEGCRGCPVGLQQAVPGGEVTVETRTARAGGAGCSRGSGKGLLLQSPKTPLQYQTSRSQLRGRRRTLGPAQGSPRVQPKGFKVPLPTPTPPPSPPRVSLICWGVRLGAFHFSLKSGHPCHLS